MRHQKCRNGEGDGLDEVVRCRAIVANGTSADAQLAVYRQARDKGAEHEEALATVSEWLAQTTLRRDDPGQHLRRDPPIWVQLLALTLMGPSCVCRAPRKR